METSAATAILHALPDPALLIDSEKTILVANESARDVLGHAIEGTSRVLVIRHPEVRNAVARVLAGAEMSQALVTPLTKTLEIH